MTDRQILLVKHSWRSVMVQPEEAGELFYTKLFELDPSLRSMFKNDRDFQSNKLVSMLTLIITKIQTIEDIMPEIQALSQRHVGYGTKAEHYPMVGQALLWMMENSAGNHWTEEARQAWEILYTMLSNAMISAASRYAPVQSTIAKPV